MSIRRALRRVLIAVLLVIGIPVIDGIITGILLTYRDVTIEKELLRQFEREYEVHCDRSKDTRRNYDDYRIPPFYQRELRSLDWQGALSLIGTEPRPGLGTKYEIASFDQAFVWKPKLRHHWVYATYMPDPENNEWDKAFDQLLQYYARRPPAYLAVPTFINCTESLLICKLWDIEQPSLIHIGGFPEDCLPVRWPEDYYGERNEEANQVCPVTATIIRFPLRSSIITTEFPTPFRQMKSLIDNEFAFTAFPAFSFVQTLEDQQRKFFDQILHQWKSFGYLNSATNTLKALPYGFGTFFTWTQVYSSLFTRLLIGNSVILSRRLYDRILERIWSALPSKVD